MSLTLIGPAFGTGKNGNFNASGVQDINTIRQSCSGTVNTRQLTVADGSQFVAGDLIFVHKSKGITSLLAGACQFNRVESVSGNTLNLSLPLNNTYNDDGGNNQSQVVRVSEHAGVISSGGNTIQPAAWNGDTGGITIICCSGITDIAGTLTVKGRGYRGGLSELVSNAYGYGGEGIAGVSGAGGNGGGQDPSGGGGSVNPGNSVRGNSQQYYSGGGGGGRSATYQNDESAGGGGGGGHVYGGGGAGGGTDSSLSMRSASTADAGGGGEGGAQQNNAPATRGSDGYSGPGGLGGDTNVGSGGGGGGANFADSSDGTTMTFGGAGGAGGRNETSGQSVSSNTGGNGGGILIILTKELKLTGSIDARGDDGIQTSGSRGGGGGGGAGGYVLIVAEKADIGTNLINCNGGVGANSTYGGQGGPGSIGRVRIEACKIIGDTNLGSVSKNEGSLGWCGASTIVM